MQTNTQTNTQTNIRSMLTMLVALGVLAATGPAAADDDFDTMGREAQTRTWHLNNGVEIKHSKYPSGRTKTVYTGKNGKQLTLEKFASGLESREKTWKVPNGSTFTHLTLTDKKSGATFWVRKSEGSRGKTSETFFSQNTNSYVTSPYESPPSKQKSPERQGLENAVEQPKPSWYGSRSTSGANWRPYLDNMVFKRQRRRVQPKRVRGKADLTYRGIGGQVNFDRQPDATGHRAAAITYNKQRNGGPSARRRTRYLVDRQGRSYNSWAREGWARSTSPSTRPSVGRRR